MSESDLPKTRDEIARELFHSLKPGDFPIEYFLLSTDNRLLELSPGLRKIFNLGVDEVLNHDIARFVVGPPYLVQKKLRQLLRVTEKNEQYEADPLHIRIDSHDWFMQVSVKKLEAPDHGLVGYLGCVLAVSEFLSSRRQLASLPVGFFSLDPEGKITYANAALAKILGFASRDEMLGKLLSDILGQSSALPDAEGGDACKSRIVRAVRDNDNEIVLVEINCQPNEVDGQDIGSNGTVIDLTDAEDYWSELVEIPVGFYEVRHKEGKDVIIACNDQYAKMHEYESGHELIGQDVKQFFPSPQAYEDYIQEIRKADAAGLDLMGYSLPIRTHKGREVILEINVKLVRNGHGEIIGRTGTARDISKEFKEKQDLKMLRADIGGMLHSYSTTLLLSRNAMHASMLASINDPFARMKPLEIDLIDEVMKHSVLVLMTSLSRMLVLMDEAAGQSRFSDVTESFLRITYRQLENLEKPEVVQGSRFHTYRMLAHALNEHLLAVNPVGFPHELIKLVQQNAREVERLACLAWLHQAENDIISTDHSLRALRDFVTTGIRTPDSKQRLFVWELVKQVMSNLQDYASSRGVEYRPMDQSYGTTVMGVERDILRALTNLLHNAIKYSWSRGANQTPWVKIRAYREGDWICIEFENYGVAIPKDELDANLIFNLGFRGRLSSERGRLGTGIGLTDSLNTAREYRGEVTVTSRPANRFGDPEDYTKPFITTVTFRIPKSSNS